ncbi:hypothetical protein Syun_014904 [Stephania yunnanensis]|uniref:Uncharacterized protein n=1 Tax=Stephania yunnanensis TaxID=152371 RepID=A0AAP0JKP5_9MAGN
MAEDAGAEGRHRRRRPPARRDRPAHRCSDYEEAVGGERWRRSRRVAAGAESAAGSVADGGPAGGGGYARSWRWCSNGFARLRELDAYAGELVRSWTTAAAAAGLRTGGSAALCEWWREHGSDVWRIGGENGGQRRSAATRRDSGEGRRPAGGGTGEAGQRRGERRGDALSTSRMRDFDEIATTRWRD